MSTATLHPSHVAQKARAAERATARAEDLAFMAEHGETLPGAARRLGITPGAVENFCYRTGERATLHRLIKNGAYL